MTAITSAIFTIVLFGGVYWFYYGPTVITAMTVDVITDTRDGKLHSLNFLKEDVDHEYIQENASILRRLYFNFKYPHGRYIVMEEVLAHIFNQFYLSTVFVGKDVVIFIEPTDGTSISSITALTWKGVGLQGAKFVIVTQRDEKGDPLHWRLYSNDEEDEL